MPKYGLSNGENMDKRKIDKKIAKAKEEFLEEFLDEHGYYFCERSKRSDLGLDCSHIISVKECQWSGRSEIAWDKRNLELLSREEHMKLERWSNAKREEWYWRRKEGMSFENFKLFNQ